MSEFPVLESADEPPETRLISEPVTPALAPTPAPDMALLRAGDLATINRQSVNCRAWMSPDAPIEGTLRRGNKVELLRDPAPSGRRTWVKIRSVVKGIEGYLPLAFLDVLELRGLSHSVDQFEPANLDDTWQVGDHFATTVRLNLRDAPGRESAVIRSLEPNIRGAVLGKNVSVHGIDWIEVQIADDKGWLAGQFARPIARGGKWIEVDLRSQTLTAWNDTAMVSRSPASTGKPGFRTPAGVYPISRKIPSRRLSGTVGEESWNIPGVPWIMIFRKGGFYIHGVYWHDDFGSNVSHGCVTLPVSYAEWLYHWTPPGTRIWIHQ